MEGRVIFARMFLAVCSVPLAIFPFIFRALRPQYHRDVCIRSVRRTPCDSVELALTRALSRFELYAIYLAPGLRNFL
jgi:hypothetical protein